MKFVLPVLLLCAVTELTEGGRKNVLKDLQQLNPLPILDPPITSFLKQIPNLFGLCTAIKAIPHRVVLQIKEFLEEIIVQIPPDNLLRSHFNNVIFLISSYKMIIDSKKTLYKQFTDAVAEIEEPKSPAMFRPIDDVTKMITDPWENLRRVFLPKRKRQREPKRILEWDDNDDDNDVPKRKIRRDFT